MLRITSSPHGLAAAPPTDTPPTAERVNTLLAENRLEEAYPLLQRLTEMHPYNVTVLSAAALTAVRLGRYDAAEQWLRTALQVAPDNFDTNYNLALVAMTRRDWTTALRRLRHLRHLDPTNTRLLSDIAIIWSNRERPGRALAAYGRALRLDPENSQTRNNAMQFCLENQQPRQALRLLERQEQRTELSAKAQAEVHHWREIIVEAMAAEGGEPPIELITSDTSREPQRRLDVRPPQSGGIRNRKIAFFAGHQDFLRGIMADLSRENETRLFGGGSVEEMRQIMAWADIAWYEWCDNFIIQGTALPKSCKIVCRLHSYEAFTDMPSKVDWSKVDQLVFVNRSVEEISRQQIPVSIPRSVVHNGVDLQRFALPPGKQTSKKIASVGYINYKKNPALLLYCFKKIHEYDPEYTLHIAGKHQDPRLQLYFQHFLQRHPLPVYFDGWVEDMPGWFADKGWVISTSLFESFHYSIAEGMASGLLPLVHDWYGADYLYPRDYLFADPDACLSLLRRLEGADHEHLRRLNREHIVQRYNADDKTAELSAILEAVCRQAEAAIPAPTTSRN